MAQDDPRAKKKCKQDDDGDNEVDGSSGAVDVDQLRVWSWRVYLKKRLDRELTVLQQALEDEKELFEGEELTSREREKNPKITTNPKKRRTMIMMTKTMLMTRSTDTFLTTITRLSNRFFLRLRSRRFPRDQVCDPNFAKISTWGTEMVVPLIFRWISSCQWIVVFFLGPFRCCGSIDQTFVVSPFFRFRES